MVFKFVQLSVFVFCFISMIYCLNLNTMMYSTQKEQKITEIITRDYYQNPRYIAL